MKAQAELIGLREVKRICGISRSEIWRRVANGTMPLPLKMGPLTTRWNRPEILAWVEKQLANRDAQASERERLRKERQQKKVATAKGTP